MTAATETVPVDHANPIEGALAERYERLPIEQIVPSRTNPRKHFDEAYIERLSLSIAEKGILEPLLVRQVDAGKHAANRFEIVAGECRWRAATKAGLRHAPALIRLLTDEQALEHQLIENLHRKDLTPLEEAAGFRALIKANPDKHSAQTIADRIGKSASWVWDLMKLLDLIPEARQLLDEGRISVGHAIPIARLKPADQKRVIDPERGGLFEEQDAELFETAAEERAAGKYGTKKARTIRELQDWIGHHIRFDVEHAAKAAPLEFEAVAAKVEEAEAQPGRGKKVIPITFDYNAQSEAASSGAERTYGSTSWKRADGQQKSKRCEHAVLGVVVAGDKAYGQTFEVCIAREKCLVHWGDVVKARQKAAKLRESGKGKQAAKAEKKAAENQHAKWEREQKQRQARERDWGAMRKPVMADAIAQVKSIKALTPALAKALERADDSGLDFAEIKTQLGATWFKTPVAALLVNAVTYDCFNSWTEDSGFDQFVKNIAKPFGLDLKRLEAIREKHAPKAEPVQTSGAKAKKAS